MPERKRKKRIRLSFIGGRRPALLGSVKTSIEKGKENDVKVNISNVNPEKTATVVDKVIKTTECNDTKVTDNVQIAPKNNKDTKNPNVTLKKKAKQNLRDKRLTLDELRQQTEKIEKGGDQSTSTSQIVLVQNELQNWKDYLLHSEVSKDIPDELEAMLCLKVDTEINKIQYSYDEWRTDAVQVKLLHEKLRLTKEVVQKEVDKISTEMQVDSNVVAPVTETPRHLIKRILNPN
ncbi:uncharacterized protein LOC130623884 [Hydractinia symbiolongicarpus]|uniref:uncharacterized protein LOC130623884 n=1 Tax=Hydractinia symbiolongicarpus TaxID=13093 RepID=UPI00254FAF85|nr:uncharacterized protein LOC130623884 [Hydractinia symbiolongicarpus]